MLINRHMDRLTSEFEMFCMYITFSEKKKKKKKKKNKVVVPHLVILTVTCNESVSGINSH